MGNIITKLNLNRTPHLVENNSMVFAKNIRVDIDGTIHKDYSINPLTIKPEQGYDKYYNDILSRILADYRNILDNDNTSSKLKECTNYFNDKIEQIINYRGRTKDYIRGSFRIIDTIANSNEFYIFIDGVYVTKENVDGASEVTHQENMIICYDEKQDSFYPCDCNWIYSGGNIDGCVINNLLGEKIINIGETGSTNYVPLKCINLSKSTYTDDESIYTQAPNIPITNLGYGGLFTFTIPNGVYQFYVRYKIREGFYTDWFPASKELFAGNKNKTITNYGTLDYVNTHTDCSKSFIFAVNHLFENYEKLYESFQIGFILSHDNATYARAWKHFNFNQTTIKFDYRATDAEEIEIIDITKPTFNLYDVGNITSFKNKLYISNYIETDFNENLKENANEIKIELTEQKASKGYSTYAVKTTTYGSKQYISAFTLKETDVNIGGENGIVDKMLNDSTTELTPKSLILDSVKNNEILNSYESSSLYDLHLSVSRDSIITAKSNIRNTLQNTFGNDFGDVSFSNNSIRNIIVNDKNIDVLNKTPEEITKIIVNNITANTVYIDENAIFVNYNRQTSNYFNIKIARLCTYTYQTYVPSTAIDRDNSYNEDLNTSGKIIDEELRPGTGKKEWRSGQMMYYQNINVRLTAYKKYLNTDNINDLINYTTLIPYQKYKFYIHYVKQNGEISNGYYCDGKEAGIIEVPYEPQCNKIIYPKFSNIKIPNGYVACFFSILHYAVKTATIYNVKEVENEKSIKIAYEGSCMELNTRLFPGSTGLEIHQYDEKQKENKVLTGDYYSSSDSSIIRYFGANGVIYIDKNLNVDVSYDKKLYLTTDYESTQEQDTTLIKCTPYIKGAFIKKNGEETPTSFVPVSYDNNTDLNLIGYICQITDTDRNRSIEYYSDGNNAYHKNNIYDVESANNIHIDFEELGKYTDSNYKISNFGLITTNTTNIYSNYNFNYLELSEEPKQVVKTYYGYSSTSTPNNTVNSTYSVLWRLLTSLTLSDTYVLPEMYKTYPRKLYFPYNPNEVIKYDNTVRSSILEGDEAHISIFRFDANDYYNIPTNRGKIINLISIGDSILVHTEDSMFRFMGSNSLQSNSGDVQPSETDVFQTGVSEVFGSDFGFAGIQNKKDTIITENGYIFFDRDSRIVYMYSGQGQIVKLSDSVEKLFRCDNIINIRFANDYYNNRFFMCIWFGSGLNITPVTLSFSLNENVKSFVSVHDFCFNEAFNTKTKCYFLTLDETDICTIDKTRIGEYYKLGYTEESDYIDSYYPIKQGKHQRYVFKDGAVRPEYITIPDYDSIIDIIDNTNFENVKTLDSLNWCSRYILKEQPEASITDNMADSEEGVYPCTSLKIYTDTCATKELDMNKIANTSSISDPNTYTYPRYNQGYWSLNYFRNILNANNLFKYLGNPKNTNPKYNDGRQKAEYRSDENSLIEGKYFVVRFDFDSTNDFKLDTVNFNYSTKL